MDVEMTKQAETALQSRLGMIRKQRLANALKLQVANGSVVLKEADRKAAKKELTEALKEQQKMQKRQKSAGAVLQNATDVLEDRNHSLTTAINAASDALVDRHAVGRDHLPKLVQFAKEA